MQRVRDSKSHKRRRDAHSGTKRALPAQDQEKNDIIDRVEAKHALQDEGAVAAPVIIFLIQNQGHVEP